MDRTTLPGRIVISLDKLYERIYRDSKSTNLPSMKLDVVGQTLFGEVRPSLDRTFTILNMTTLCMIFSTIT